MNNCLGCGSKLQSIDSSKEGYIRENNISSKFDDSYYKEFNPIANKLSTDFSKISSKDSNDLTYIKEVLILLQASHDWPW